MKKQVASVLSVLALTACASTTDSTLFGMLDWCFDRKPEYKEIEIERKDLIIDVEPMDSYEAPRHVQKRQYFEQREVQPVRKVEKVEYVKVPVENDNVVMSSESVSVAAPVKETEIEVVKAAPEAAVVAAPAEAEKGYVLPKRADRYEAASYTLSPEVYAIVATRTVNKMLEEAPALFAKNKDAKVFIEPTTQVDRLLPDGPDAAGKAAREILVGSQMFNIVDDKDSADFILTSAVNNVNTPEVPVIIYRMELMDKDGNQVGYWKDSIRQVQNDDKRWW